MRKLILPSLAILSCCLLASCGTPSADKPDLGEAPPKCDPQLQADIPPEPSETAGAGIVKPAPGSAAADATDKFLNDVGAKMDWARGDLLPRARLAKAFCDRLDGKSSAARPPDPG
jgi:hypothetical protein